MPKVTFTIRVSEIKTAQSADELKKIEEKIDKASQKLIIHYYIITHEPVENIVSTDAITRNEWNNNQPEGSSEKSPIERWAEGQ